MSNEPIKDPDGNTPAHYWALGGMWLLILLGLGGCCLLANRSGSGPLIAIETEAAPCPR